MLLRHPVAQGSQGDGLQLSRRRVGKLGVETHTEGEGCRVEEWTKWSTLVLQATQDQPTASLSGTFVQIRKRCSFQA